MSGAAHTVAACILPVSIHSIPHTHERIRPCTALSLYSLQSPHTDCVVSLCVPAHCVLLTACPSAACVTVPCSPVLRVRWLQVARASLQAEADRADRQSLRADLRSLDGRVHVIQTLLRSDAGRERRAVPQRHSTSSRPSSAAPAAMGLQPPSAAGGVQRQVGSCGQGSQSAAY